MPVRQGFLAQVTRLARQGFLAKCHACEAGFLSPNDMPGEAGFSTQMTRLARQRARLGFLAQMICLARQGVLTQMSCFARRRHRFSKVCGHGLTFSRKTRFINPCVITRVSRRRQSHNAHERGFSTFMSRGGVSQPTCHPRGEVYQPCTFCCFTEAPL